MFHKSLDVVATPEILLSQPIKTSIVALIQYNLRDQVIIRCSFYLFGSFEKDGISADTPIRKILVCLSILEILMLLIYIF